MKKYRITVANDEASYSYVERLEDEDCPMTIGSWEAPFPNTKEESTAFGVVESLSQSDECPEELRINGITKVTIEKA